MKKLLLRVLDGERGLTPPIWLMRQAGRFLPEYRAVRKTAGSFLELCYTPELAAEVTLQPVHRFGMDAAILFSDILVVPDALGQTVRFVEGEGPVLEPVRDAAGLSGLSMAGFESHLAPVMETVRRVRQDLPAHVALIGFAGSPWTVATYVVEGASSRDYANVKGWAFGDPEGFSKLIGLLVEATTAYLCAQIDAGVEVVQLFDSWASVLPEAEFRAWVIAPTKEIVAGVRARHPNVPIIGFPRGAGLLTEAYVAETGVNGIGLDSQVPPGWAAKVLQPRVAVQGNLDPIFLLRGGQGMRRAVGDILQVLGGGPLIFNLGHGVLPATPPEHAAELIAMVREMVPAKA
ncbi:MAG: uroporphyrinogen decarboxylase [Alphaproteobacteria bacterium]